MKRATLYGGALSLVATILVGLKVYQQELPVGVLRDSVDVLPWFLLILFSAGCLSKLGIDMISFNDYPKEIAALAEDIKEARADLKRRGFKGI